MVSNGNADRRYRSDIAELRAMLLEMGGLVEDALATAVELLARHDNELFERIRQTESQVNALEKQIDERCVRILALHQPTASDLRFVTQSMKLSTDLERIGDLAKNVADRALMLRRDEAPALFADIPHLTDLVRAMITAALDAFVERSVERAEAVLLDDDAVDTLHWQLLDRLEGVMQTRPEFVPRGMKLMLVIKDLERAADHATNIAEGVVFMVRGRDIRHSG